ncbi:MAG: hypothetical protein R3304_02865 [Longimicrobiales bacterium]|nr:hypothetical protein [Longimicrobiales bacterium]
MALAPDDSPWYRKFRMLLGIYLIAIAFGVREYVVSRQSAPVDPETEEWSQMAEVVSQINPADADTEYLKALEALKAGDRDAFVGHMETALDKGVKHNDVLLRWYAQHLFSTGEDYRLVNSALERWRTNHPFTAEPLEIPMGSGPSGPADEEALARELERVPWILRHELQPPDEEDPGWRALVYIRPATQIDIRQAVAAVSILALPPELREDFRVTCLTLEDCRRVPR